MNQILGLLLLADAALDSITASPILEAATLATSSAALLHLILRD
jgi:hypothetical protein